MSVTTSVQEMVNDDLDKRFRMGIAMITWIIILFVPIYSKTVTGPSFHERITEVSYIWPWMVLTRYTPQNAYSADQFAVVAFPWSFLMFIPSMYAFKSAWSLYTSNKDKLNHSGQIILASIAQYILIFMTYKSQDPSVSASEEVIAYFFPQIMLIIIHSILSVKWFLSEFNQGSKLKNE